MKGIIVHPDAAEAASKPGAGMELGRGRRQAPGKSGTTGSSAAGQRAHALEGLLVRPVFCIVMKSRVAFLGLALMALSVTGCSTANSSRVAPTGTPDPWQSLAKDMSADQVRAALGQPIEVRPLQSPGAEIWVYRRITSREVRMAPFKMEDVPYVDPTTGQQRTAQEPVYSQEVHTVEEELQLLLYEGRLVTWKNRFLSARTYE
jgi:hypothetical protein